MTMTLADREGHIWFDGEIVPWKEAQTCPYTYASLWPGSI